MKQQRFKNNIISLLIIIGMCLAGYHMVAGFNGENSRSGEENIETFSSENLSATWIAANEIEILCDYVSEEPLSYAWYIYDLHDKGTPIEKIDYSDENTLHYTIPEGSRYSFKCFILGQESGLKQSAWLSDSDLGAWAFSSIQDFTRLCVTVSWQDDSSYKLEHYFVCKEDYETAWYVYYEEDKNNPIMKTPYSKETSFVYSLPDPNRKYVVKVFIKGLISGEKKSLWVANLPLEKQDDVEDPIPEFTYRDIERSLLEKGYQFTNTFEGGSGEFRVYEKDGATETLVDTVTGNTLVFDNYDENKNYILRAYEKLPDGREKELDFYYFYEHEFVNLLIDELVDTTCTVDDILQGKYLNYDISYPLDWSLPDISDRDIRAKITGFRIFVPLLKEYARTEDKALAKICLKYIEQWLDIYKEVPVEEDDDMWNDFSVSRRTLFFSTARILFDHYIDNDLLNKLESYLQQSSERSISPLYYKDKHNHGMFQDFALLYYLDSFGYTENKAEEYRQLACQRLNDYFDYAISSDGVHKEHSPDYHANMIDYVEWYDAYSHITGNSDTEKWHDIVDKMFNFYIALMEPDFTWPPLGDSYSDIYCPSNFSNHEYSEWMLSKGNFGSAPNENMSVFPEGGYAIMRSSWTESAEKATYICLTAATHSIAHKHQDDLSFILYHRGQLFTEAGKRNYNYNDPETEYAYSSYGHNVLFVNGQGWPMSETGHPVLDDAAYQTKIVDYGQEGDTMWATARSERWPTVLQERSINYNRQENFVSITDTLTASENEDVRLIYHIAEDVDIVQTEDGWKLLRGNDLLAVVHVEATSDVSLSTLQGNEADGEFKTWLFDHDHIDSPKYGGLLIIDMECTIGDNRIGLNVELK